MTKQEKMAATFLVLNAADYVTTKKILKSGGKELNPIANFFIKKKLFGLLKIISGILGSFSILSDESGKSSKKLLALYGVVVTNNVIQITKQNKKKKKRKIIDKVNI